MNSPTKGKLEKILVFGATGKTGSRVVERLLNRGYAVTAFVRDTQKVSLRHPQLRLHTGDVLNPASVEQAVAGHDAVVSCLGAGLKGVIRAEGTLNIIRAMEKTSVQRLISQSSLGVGESRGNLNFFWKYLMFGLLLRKAYKDHGLQEGHIKASGLDWTIVRPAGLTEDEAVGEYRHGFSANEKRLSLTISLEDLAEFMVQELEDGTYLHQSPGLSYGEVER